MAPESGPLQLHSSKVRPGTGKEVERELSEIAAPQFAWVNEDEDLVKKVTACEALTAGDP